MLSASSYDAFLCHSSQDSSTVEELARRLGSAGLDSFFAGWHVVPGEPWQDAIENALNRSRTCVVALGPGKIRPWQNEEMRAALDLRARDSRFRVIPVLLPGAPPPERIALPSFLKRLEWVDLRAGFNDPDAMNRLVSGIKGKPPGPPTAQAPRPPGAAASPRLWIALIILFLAAALTAGIWLSGALLVDDERWERGKESSRANDEPGELSLPRAGINAQGTLDKDSDIDPPVALVADDSAKRSVPAQEARRKNVDVQPPPAQPAVTDQGQGSATPPSPQGGPRSRLVLKNGEPQSFTSAGVSLSVSFTDNLGGYADLQIHAAGQEPITEAVLMAGGRIPFMSRSGEHVLTVLGYNPEQKTLELTIDPPL